MTLKDSKLSLIRINRVKRLPLNYKKDTIFNKMRTSIQKLMKMKWLGIERRGWIEKARRNLQLRSLKLRGSKRFRMMPSSFSS